MLKTLKFKADTGGVTEPKGFCAAAAHSDIRGKQDGRLDTGIIYSETPCSAAGVLLKTLSRQLQFQTAREFLILVAISTELSLIVEMPMLAPGSRDRGFS